MYVLKSEDCEYADKSLKNKQTMWLVKWKAELKHLMHFMGNSAEQHENYEAQ